MLSLELAKRLKELGLEWEPKLGDLLYCENGAIGAIEEADLEQLACETAIAIEEGEYIFAPRSDRLLAEIEERGYWWVLGHTAVERGVHKYEMVVHSLQKAEIFIADSPTEATAQALIWILEQEGAN